MPYKFNPFTSNFDLIDTGVGTFTRTEVQFTSQTSISITHNNGFKPAVTVLDSSGFERTPNDIEHTSDNAFTVTFTSAESGFIVYDSSGVPDSGVPAPIVVEADNDYTTTATDGTIKALGTRSFTITLVSAATLGSGEKQIVKHTGSGVLTINFSGTETADDVTSLTVNAGLPGAYVALGFQSDGSNYMIV